MERVWAFGRLSGQDQNADRIRDFLLYLGKSAAINFDEEVFAIVSSLPETAYRSSIIVAKDAYVFEEFLTRNHLLEDFGDVKTNPLSWLSAIRGGRVV
jgi:hypothetical protein